MATAGVVGPINIDANNSSDPQIQKGGQPGEGEGEEEVPMQDIPKDQVEKLRVLRLRTWITGGLVGSICTCSNVYIGLKTGWGLGSSIFAAIFGFAILSPLSRRIPWMAPMNIKEGCALQTAGSAAGGLSAGFVSAIPALFMLNVLTENVNKYISHFFLWTLSAAYFGIFVAVPLRSYFLEKQKLVFPAGIATAEVLQGLFESAEGAHGGMKKAKIMLLVFLLACCWKVFTDAVMPVLYLIPIFWYISDNGRIQWAADADLFKWRICLTPAFISIGMLMGAGAAISYLLGSLIAWAVVGPYLYYSGEVSRVFGFNVDNPSAQYWLLWPGITIMVVGGFADLFCNYKVLYHAVQGICSETWQGLRRFFSSSSSSARRNSHLATGQPPAPSQEGEEAAEGEEGGVKGEKEKGKEEKKRLSRPQLSAMGTYLSDSQEVSAGGEQQEGEEADKAEGEGEEVEEEPLHLTDDTTPMSERIPRAWWVSGLFISGGFTVFVLSFFFKIAWWQVILALFMAFVLAFIGIQSSGECSINPVGVIGKCTQLVFAAVAPGNVSANLLSGNVAGSCAGQSVDLMTDFKTGQLVRAPPRPLFFAQMGGAMFGVFFTVGAFWLFASAYPCILEFSDDSCDFAVPAGKAWAGVAQGLTNGFDKSVPPSSAWACVAAAGTAVILSLLRKFLPQKYAVFVPSANAIGLGFVVPQPYLGIAMVMGAGIAAGWKRCGPKSHDEYMQVIAAALSAGEGFGGVVFAFMIVAGYSWGGIQAGLSPTETERIAMGLNDQEQRLLLI
uniref:Oligopeptide transporter n=1 Tax=Chromera velia CCMP2878 TaxID=1169474 RepID=A0A0G4FDZ0_9ALVE|eukprot:Cvel_16420.t1-p1 / transcript=Cvel_16420.t1 / gene=Cvel_16420 / organism=Chromera_velia_CCMP2878 / gene_product=Putative oligopeptide transporter YGL114W, putative / transcript_product=Putative oligopeptide transporter YGL114W, putative / location=Cvel_scaffold1264:43115-45901(-) / protein_length=782 / sequence_SO=supercontig / SO=protein_coding / is_pseudo=false